MDFLALKFSVLNRRLSLGRIFRDRFRYQSAASGILRPCDSIIPVFGILKWQSR